MPLIPDGINIPVYAKNAASNGQRKCRFSHRFVGVESLDYPLRYHGDGKFTVQGVFSYPRYGVTFADIPLERI